MSTNKPSDLSASSKIWGSTGLKVDPDSVVSGKVSGGWVSGELPPHTYFNWFQNRSAEALAHINENGIADWDSQTAYEIGALVKASDNLIYRCIANNTGDDPTAVASSWENFARENGVMKFNSTVNSMLSIDHAVGDIVYCNGLDSEGDTGESIYIIKAPGSVDNIIDFSLNNGNSAYRVWPRRDTPPTGPRIIDGYFTNWPENRQVQIQSQNSRVYVSGMCRYDFDGTFNTGLSSNFTAFEFDSDDNIIPGNPRYYMNCFNADNHNTGQTIHNLRFYVDGGYKAYAGKKCTFEFWARSNSTPHDLTIYMQQITDTSTAQTIVLAAPQTIAVGWNRYKFTFDMPTLPAGLVETEHNHVAFVLQSNTLSGFNFDLTAIKVNEGALSFNEEFNEDLEFDIFSRYFQSSYEYRSPSLAYEIPQVFSFGAVGVVDFYPTDPTAGTNHGHVSFNQNMRKIPSIVSYDPSHGAGNTFGYTDGSLYPNHYYDSAAPNILKTLGIEEVNRNGFNFYTATAPATFSWCTFHWVADARYA